MTSSHISLRPDFPLRTSESFGNTVIISRKKWWGRSHRCFSNNKIIYNTYHNILPIMRVALPTIPICDSPFHTPNIAHLNGKPHAFKNGTRVTFHFWSMQENMIKGCQEVWSKMLSHPLLDASMTYYDVIWWRKRASWEFFSFPVVDFFIWTDGCFALLSCVWSTIDPKHSVLLFMLLTKAKSFRYGLLGSEHVSEHVGRFMRNTILHWPLAFLWSHLDLLIENTSEITILGTFN